MDVQQLVENIAICESQIDDSINLSLVKTLMVLYQKVIEFLSAI